MRVIKETSKKCAQLLSARRQFPTLKNGFHRSQAGLVAIRHQDEIRPHNWLTPPHNINGGISNTIPEVVDKPASKGFHQQKTPNENQKPLPRLLYVQNPLVWISNKLDFRFLRLTWDPLFSEAEFTRGARQAVSTVTQMVSRNMFDSMKPMLTKNALLNLRRDVEITWADEVRRNIALRPEDVQLIIPRKLHFRQAAEHRFLQRRYEPPGSSIIVSPKKNLNEKKFCDIDVLFIGLKWLEEHKIYSNPLVFVDIVARFHRNYTEGITPEWTISAFKVRRFNLVPPKT